jgi:two-component sensor histidine kinase
VARALRQTDALRAEAERRIDRMMSELDHRVKNTMAIVISLCDLTAGGSRSLPEFQEAYRGRLTAMARAHEALAAMRWKGVDLRFIIDAVVVGFAPPRRDSLEIDGGNLLLPPHVALPMAVTLHELATNALKHGAWCRGSPEGRVKLLWRVSDANELTLEWSERGGAIPETSPTEGFGLSLIRSMIPHELRGKVEVTFGADGVACRVRTPIRNGNLDAYKIVA